MWRHKNPSLFWGVSFPTSPLILHFHTYFYDVTRDILGFHSMTTYQEESWSQKMGRVRVQERSRWVCSSCSCMKKVCQTNTFFKQSFSTIRVGLFVCPYVRLSVCEGLLFSLIYTCYNCSIDFKLCMMIHVTVRYNLKSLPESPYVHLKHVDFLVLTINFMWYSYAFHLISGIMIPRTARYNLYYNIYLVNALCQIKSRKVN